MAGGEVSKPCSHGCSSGSFIQLLCGGEAVEGAAICIGEDSLALEAQGDAGLPPQIQHYFRSRVHVINSRASG